MAILSNLIISDGHTKTRQNGYVISSIFSPCLFFFWFSLSWLLFFALFLHVSQVFSNRVQFSCIYLIQKCVESNLQFLRFSSSFHHILYNHIRNLYPRYLYELDSDFQYALVFARFFEKLLICGTIFNSLGHWRVSSVSMTDFDVTGWGDFDLGTFYLKSWVAFGNYFMPHMSQIWKHNLQ